MNVRRAIQKAKDLALELAKESQFVVEAEADATTRARDRENKNYGDDPGLMVKDDSSPNTRMVFLRLDVSKHRAKIKTAKLRLSCLESNGEEVDHAFLVGGNTWNEATITWSNLPPKGKEIAQWPKPKTGETIQIDITPAAELARAKGGKLSICIYSKGYPHSRYASREHGDKDLRPAILIE